MKECPVCQHPMEELRGDYVMVTCGKRKCVERARSITSTNRILHRRGEGAYGFYLRDMGWEFVDD